MHISDGVLSAPVYTCSSVIAAVTTAYTLTKTKSEDIPKISVMTASFFVVSLLRVPIGFTSSHPMLNGLVGIILGISAFPAILVALLFQAIMFQHGGITTLGANSISMGLPALLAYAIFRVRIFIKTDNRIIKSSLGFICGAFSVTLSAILFSLFLLATGKEFLNTAKLLVGIHIPIAIIEGLLTAFVISFLQRVKPEMIT